MVPLDISLVKFLYAVNSGVAGPLAAQGGGQICRPFALLGRHFAAKDPT